MGKNKQAQRTKNNARPSNSSRSAELLGTSMPNFVGFSAVKDGGYVPILPGLTVCKTNEVEMSSVDTNFQVVLKKMNKKDATTKFKALQEFATMCKDSEISAVEGMLPFWPRLYCSLSIDVEHRVREAAQLAHASVVKRVGKGIAMYLKQLAGAWFTSQYDTYPPAASAATNSFNETFPPKKIVDAIVHCQQEILTYICDNVTVHTAQTLSLQKSLTPEEMESKYQKVLVASLQGYSCYLRKVPGREIEKMIEIHKKIVNNNKFWKLVKHDSLPVKTAFFNVLTSLIENADVLIRDEKKRVVTAIMNSLDENEPGLLSAIWEAVLVAINKIEDWYNVVSIEKLVLPKLWRVLRSGGQCCASIVYPNLLLFVNQFPKLNVDTHNLYVNFFNNMRQGFTAKSVLISRSEMHAVATSFVECLRYSILLNSSDQDICLILLKEQLIPVLEMCLKENTSMKQTLFCELTHLVRYWSKNRNNEEYKSYACLIKEFWNELSALLNRLINDSQDPLSFDIPDTNSSQIEFLLALKSAPAHNRKNLKVKFSDPNDIDKTDTQSKNMEVETDTVFQFELNNLVNSLCITYFNKINEQHAKKYIIHLNKLVTCFDDRQLSIILSESLRTEINFFNFYNEVLLKWLLEKSAEAEHIVELIFNLLKYMNESEKDEVLKLLIELNDMAITRSVIQCGLSKNNRNDPVIKKWCSQSKVASLLINTANEIASGNYDDLDKNQKLILLAFETSDNGDLLIKEENVNEIVSTLRGALREIDENRLLQFAKLICRIVPLTFTHKQTICSASQALEILFELCIHEYFSNDSDFIGTMRDVWKNGLLKAIQKLGGREFIELTRKFATVMWKKIYNTQEQHTRKLMVDIATDFIEVVINDDIIAENDIAKEIVLMFLIESNVKTWMTEFTEIIMYAEVITGKLYVTSLNREIQIHQNLASIDLTRNIVEDNTKYCLMWSHFNTSLLKNLYQRSHEDVSNIEEVSTEFSQTPDIDIPGITDILMNVKYTIILGEVYDNYYKSTKNYACVNKFLALVQDNFKHLERYFNNEIHDTTLNDIQRDDSENNSMLPHISAIIKARCTLDDENSTFDTILQEIMAYEKENPAVLLLDCDISDITWEKMTMPLEVIRLITGIINKNPAKLSPDHWNFTLISLVLWQLSINKSKSDANDFKRTALTVAICQLYDAIQNVIHKHEKESIESLPSALLDEWKNVFAGDVQSGLIKTWMFYGESYSEKTAAVKPVIALDYLGKAVKHLDGNILFDDRANISLTVVINLDETIKSSLKFIQSPVVSIQLGAYHILKLIVPELVKRDAILVESENFDTNALNIKKIDEVLLNTQNIVNTMLMDFKLCDTVSCTIQPYTDSYTYTLGYLLEWAIILEMCAKANGDLRYQYAEILKDNYFPCLLDNVFRLMPVEVLQDNKKKGAKSVKAFFAEPSLDFGESWTESRLDHIVCWLYTNSLRHLPVLARQWWSTADSRVSAAVDKITTHYVSPMLCQEELQNNRLITIENMQVKVHPSAREVVALYQMDDTKLELSIVLPPNHPLLPVTVEPGQHVGGTANWRNCHMQLSIFLTHQNGSIWDGLALWKRNLDKKFAGVEECHICFSIFLMGTYQLPKLSCHTCRKAFHTPCLYKWFSTSQKSSCPICRNVF